MSEPETFQTVEPKPYSSPPHVRRDGLGVFIGLLTFFFGIALLALTFRAAYALFETPPQAQLGISQGKPIDLGVAGSSIASTVFKVIFLVIMALIGSLIANRGIGLYCGARNPHSTGPLR